MNNQKGQIFILSALIISISVFLVLLISGFVVSGSRQVRDYYNSLQAYYSAESWSEYDLDWCVETAKNQGNRQGIRQLPTPELGVDYSQKGLDRDQLTVGNCESMKQNNFTLSFENVGVSGLGASQVFKKIRVECDTNNCHFKEIL